MGVMSDLCCTEKKFIGCFNSCDEIDTGLIATQAGVHTIRSYYLSSVSDVTVTIGLGNNIIFPNVYNETGQTVIKIINPDGSTFIDGTADCFLMSFAIKL